MVTAFLVVVRLFIYEVVRCYMKKTQCLAECFPDRPGDVGDGRRGREGGEGRAGRRSRQRRRIHLVVCGALVPSHRLLLEVHHDLRPADEVGAGVLEAPALVAAA